MMPHVVLASGSPRRKQLLEEMGLKFLVAPADADETVPEGAAPEQAAEELARRKAELAGALWPESLVIAADTVVAVDGQILGKPADRQDAARMLRLLQGREHAVVTGVCVAWGGALSSTWERTLVRFDRMTEQDIEQYISTGEPMDKAGAYGIQGKVGEFIGGITGCYFNVMGLPKATLRKLLVQTVGEAGYRVLTMMEGE